MLCSGEKVLMCRYGDGPDRPDRPLLPWDLIHSFFNMKTLNKNNL